jgi:5'-methylthioadenosine nucleosidase
MPTLVVQFAMAGEAAPFLSSGAAFTRLPADGTFGFQYHRRGDVVVAFPGAHPRFGVDAIGSVPAALLTHAVISRFSPARLINAGTAGGFQSRGGAIGDVYLGASPVVFHDRRIALPGFEAMGVGSFPVESDAALAAKLGVKVGAVTTGDSLDATPEDLKRMNASGAHVKEMEAAAVAWVCERHKVPLVLIKAITDLVDHHEDTADQFTRNYALAVQQLSAVLGRAVEHFTASR